MNSVTNYSVSNQICQKATEAVGVASFIAGDPDLLQKVFKAFRKAFEFISAAFDYMPAPVKAFCGQAKSVEQMIDAVKFAVNARDMSNGSNLKGSWIFRADKINMFFHTAFKAVNAGVEFGFISLGRIGKYAIGHLPIFKLMTDGFLLASNCFGIWDASSKLPKQNASLDRALYKLDRSNERLLTISLLQKGSKVALKDLEKDYSMKYAQNAALLEKEAATLTPAELAKTQARIEKYERRLNKIAEAYEKGVDPIIAELSAKDPVYQTKRWTVATEKARIERKASWIKILNNVVKIAVVTLALTMIAFNFWVLPATLSLFALGCASDSIGIAKGLYAQYCKPPALLPEKPVIAAA